MPAIGPLISGCAWCTRTVALNRRNFVVGAGAMALGLSASEGASAQATSAKPFRIDVDHHLSPPSYVAAASESGVADPLMKNWAIEKSLADMDNSGVAVAMLSVTTPALNFTRGEKAASWRVNRTSMRLASSRNIPAGSAVSPCCR